MALTVRDVVLACYSYLRSDQRAIPHSGDDLDDPLPAALRAINATMQLMGAMAPQFATKRPKAAFYRAPATVAVAGLTRGGTTAICTSWPTGAAGCVLQLPGDDNPNRVVSINGTTATLQFPHLSDSAAGNGMLTFDSVDLPADVIAVTEPVRTRGGVPLRAANGRFNLTQPVYTESNDYGRRVVSVSQGSGAQAYFIDSVMIPGTSAPTLRMMLRDAPSADLVIEYQARCALGNFTAADVYTGTGPYTPVSTPVPVPNEFVESVFLPIALSKFFGTAVVQNIDAPGQRNIDAIERVARDAQEAMAILERMRPQRNKRVSLYP